MSAKEKLSSLIMEAEMAWYEDGDGDKNKFIAGYLMNHFGPLKGCMTKGGAAKEEPSETVAEHINRLNKECRGLYAELILGV